MLAATTRVLATTIALSLTLTAGPISSAMASTAGENAGPANPAALPDFSQLAATSGRAVVNVTVIEK
ncbi:MAG TPA: hypothetical protein VNR40_08115, partial [Steroidobacter sp.]|nr:hypothetical protein [Steroidobacter sp.]